MRRQGGEGGKRPLKSKEGGDKKGGGESNLETAKSERVGGKER